MTTAPSTDRGATNVSASTEAISAAASAAAAFNNFASTIEGIVSKLGLNTGEGEQEQAKVATEQQVRELLAPINGQLDAHTAAINGVKAGLASLSAVVNQFTDAFTTLNRLANPVVHDNIPE